MYHDFVLRFMLDTYLYFTLEISDSILSPPEALKLDWDNLTYFQLLANNKKSTKCGHLHLRLDKQFTKFMILMQVAPKKPRVETKQIKFTMTKYFSTFVVLQNPISRAN